MSKNVIVFGIRVCYNIYQYTCEDELMDEARVVSGNFIFISYSHKDLDAVREDCAALDRRNARIWYDEHMHLSDNWKQRAEDAIKHENCKGVVFYVSKNSVLSEAVESEIKWTKERLEGGDFHYWTVVVGAEDMSDVYSQAMQINKNFFKKIVPFYFEMFNDDNIAIRRENCEQCVDMIVEKIAKVQGVVDNEEELAKRIRRTSEFKDSSMFRFGGWAGDMYDVPVDEDGRHSDGGRTYISFNHKAYLIKPLDWKLLYTQDAKAVLICNDILEYTKGGEDVEKFLNDVVYKLAFDDEEKSRMKAKPRLLSVKEIEEHKIGADKLATSGAGQSHARHWWLADDGLYDGWQMTYGGFPNKNGFIKSVKKGVRPVIEIATNDIEKK